MEPKLWDRVQALLGQKVYKQHQMTYASDLIECAHCGSPITGERKLRDEEAELRLEIERCSRGRNELIDIAVKAIELSQTLRQRWVTADYAAKRRILEIVCLNCTLDDVNLSATMRKPFDQLAKGLVSKDSRGDRI